MRQYESETDRMKESDGWCDGVNETLYLSPHLCRGLYLSNPSPPSHTPSLHGEKDRRRERRRGKRRDGQISDNNEVGVSECGNEGWRGGKDKESSYTDYSRYK